MSTVSTCIAGTVLTSAATTSMVAEITYDMLTFCRTAGCRPINGRMAGNKAGSSIAVTNSHNNAGIEISINWMTDRVTISSGMTSSGTIGGRTTGNIAGSGTIDVKSTAR